METINELNERIRLTPWAYSTIHGLGRLFVKARPDPGPSTTGEGTEKSFHVFLLERQPQITWWR
jgi:hypothetical protein